MQQMHKTNIHIEDLSKYIEGCKGTEMVDLLMR